MAHTTVAGEPCTAHPPNADDLLAPAALGTACFAALHDLASALQAIGNAIDELDVTVTVTDPILRPLVDAAIEANDNATKMFVAIRGILRDPAGRKQPVDLATLISRASHQAATKPIVAGTPPPGTVDVAVPVVAMALAKLVDAAATGGGAEVVPRVDGDAVAIAITATTAAPPPASIGATLAIAARAIEVHGGTVQCGDTGGRATYVIRLPFTAR